MSYEYSLNAKIGDRMVADYNNGIFEKGDICVILEKSVYYEKCTEAYFFNETKKINHFGNVQSFTYFN